MSAHDARDPRLPREDDQVEPDFDPAVSPIEDDPHEGLEAVGKRTNAMKVIAGVIVSLLVAGAGGAVWIGSLETRASATAREVSIRADFARRGDDCEKRLRAIESWRERSDERNAWMMRAIDAIGRKLNAPLSPPPLPQIEGLKP